MTKNMIKALRWRLRKSLGRFHMSIVNGCSETALFRQRPNQDFHGLYFRKYISCDNHPFYQNV